MAMVLSTKLQLVLLFLLHLTLVVSPLSINPDSTTPLNLKNETIEIHEFLQLHGLPKGLLPDNVKSYSYSPRDNIFTVELTKPCYTMFQDGDNEVQYETIIKGQLNFYGTISSITGIQVRKFYFLWFAVNSFEYDFISDTLFIDAGWLAEKLPANLFKTIPSCKKYVQQESQLLASNL